MTGGTWASLKARLKGSAKQETNSAAHKNVSPPSEGPRAQPHPIVGMGRPGQPQVGNTHLGVNQEHLASTAGSDAGSAGVGASLWDSLMAGTFTGTPGRPSQAWPEVGA